MAVLDIQQLTKTEGNSTLLPPVDLQIHERQCVAIWCRHEIGKALLHLLAGWAPPSEGRIVLQGQLLSENSKNLMKQVGVFFLDDRLYGRLKVKEYLSFFKRLYGTNTPLDDVIQQVGLRDKKGTRCSRLTFSEKRRLHLARCIIHRPALVLLEDPEHNVDMESRAIIRRTIEYLTDSGTAVLLTTPFLEDAISITGDVYRLNEQGLKKIETSDADDDSLNDVKEKDEPTLDSGHDTDMIQPVRLEKVPAKWGDKIILFDPVEIDFVESVEGVSHLHVKGESFPCALTLSDLEFRLNGYGFYRCHRSYVVNLQRVREVVKWTRSSYSLILDDQKKSSIPLSKSNLSELKKTLGF
jgi:ABC-2 type transport system ATP-binding protein